jgi:regulator of sirC expression with transglutaminase-like and TPR domain
MARRGATLKLVGMLSQKVIDAFAGAALSPDPDLAVAALMIARIEYPALDAGPYLDELDRWGAEAGKRVREARGPVNESFLTDSEILAGVRALNDYIFGELGFSGDNRHFEDPRNSFLNAVLDRRAGIPITLALVYMEVARRAGVAVAGVNFPGRFLLRSPGTRSLSEHGDLIIDPFGGGALLSEARCRELLREHAGDEAVWHARLLGRATKPQMLVRMLLNLKHAFVRMYSFPQARDVTELLLAIDPSALNELRDRGLLAYHLNDFHAALRDLQAYLRLSSNAATGGAGPREDGEADEHAEIWEHVKTLRRRVATFN